MVGMMMPGRPIYEDYDHADYDALWGVRKPDLGLPICFHILTSREGSLNMPHRGHEMNNFLGIIRAVQDVVGLMVLGGVFRASSAFEARVCRGRRRLGCRTICTAWTTPPGLTPRGGIIDGLSKLPSEYIKEQCPG